MAERNIHADLKTSLIANEPFIPYHLVKFEKPKASNAQGLIAGIATDYTYITDAPYNFSFDDESVSAEGDANGTQIYVANKLSTIGAIQETTEARASSTSIKFAAEALGTITTITGTITSSTFVGNMDLVEIGFREGDKVRINSATNNDKYVRFDLFSTESGIENSKVTFTAIDSISGATQATTFTLVSEELNALIEAKSSTLYSNYINREVYIYKAHANPVTGAIIGAPFLLFKGIIANGSIQEAPDSSSSVTWGLTSHWGDFVRVQGRRTSDSSHRALDIGGKSDIDALIRPEYLTDYGFMHSERSINVLATYQAQELRYKSKKRGGISGWFGGIKIVEYYETVDRDVDLRFNLAATYLPVVYGVQKVSSIPIFADIDKNSPKDLYVIYALCEGEIGGIFDIHVDQQSSVCIDSMDEEVRGTAAVAVPDNNIAVACYGRADRGDVLAGGNYVTGTRRETYLEDLGANTYDFFLRGGGIFGRIPNFDNIGPDNNDLGAQGLTHESSYTFQIPIDATFIVHTGKPDQAADQVFVAKATAKEFKVQNDYFEGDPANYWGTSHRLLDTANVACKFTISEGEETVPEYEFVVKGSYIECYNYDQSFKHDPSVVGELHTNFNIGDTVNVITDGTTHSGVQIIDKWIMYDKNANADVRFRWRTNYPAGGDTLVFLDGGTTLQMTKGPSTWSMITYDHQVVSNSAVNLPAVTISSAAYVELSSGEASLTLELAGGGGGLNTLLTNAPDNSLYLSITSDPQYSFLVESYDAGTVTLAPHSAAAYVLTNKTYGSIKAYISNAVSIPSAAGVETTASNITVTRVVDNIPVSSQKKVSAIVSNTIITADPFDASLIPNLDPVTGTALGTADTFSVGPTNDERVSINPAIQLLDYITNFRYGKGLSITDNLNLETFLESARLCDDRSKVKVVCTSAPTLESIYTYSRGDGSLIFQGRVTAVDTRVHSTGIFYEVTFDDVIGKLGYKFNTARTYKIGDLVWGFDTVRVAVANSTLTEASFSALTPIASFNLTKVGGGSLTVSTARLGGVKNTNSIVRSWTPVESQFSSPGYSLHDSDDVKYWKYIGWDEPEQRYVTRHQLNQLVNTNTPIFDNINSMLGQFNGILRYPNGKYELDIKTAQPASFVAGINSISEDDIIGDIKLDDKAQRNSYNSINAAIIDPQNKFGSRTISYFNSNYLKEDKGIPKQGNFAMPGVSNFFNARTNIIQFLDQSRYGLSVSFTLHPRAYLLLSGEVIVINYKRFGWVNKAFRLDVVTINPDGTVVIEAEEHNNAAYLIDYSDRSAVDQFGNLSNLEIVAPPTGLTATQDLRGEIQLSWTNSAAYNTLKYEVEIFAAEAAKDTFGDYILDSLGDPTGNDFANAVFLDHTDGDRYVHDGFGSAANHFWFYWIRYAVPSITNRAPTRYSNFEPLSTGPGVMGNALSSAGLDAITIILDNEAHTLPANDLDEVYDYTGSGTNIWVYEGSNLLSYEAVSGDQPDGTWAITDIEDTNITVGPKDESTDGTFVYVGDHFDMNTSGYASINYHIEGKRSGGEAISIYKRQSFTLAANGTDGDQGSAGLDAKAVKLTASDYVIMYDQDEANPIPSGSTGILLTATAQNLTNPWFKFSGDGIPSEPDFTAPLSGDPAFSKTFDYDVPPDYFNSPKTIQVQVADGDLSNPVALAFDSISIFAVHPGIDGSEGVDGRSVRLTAGTLVFKYDTAGLSPENPSADLTDITKTLVRAWPYSVNVPYFEFFLDDVSQGAPTTSQFYTYTAPALSTDMPQKIEVEVREGSAGGTIVARDQTSMSALRFGSSAITIVLSNEAHTIPVTNTGTFDFSGSGTTIRVYEGATELECDLAWDGIAPGKWDIAITDINVIAGAPSEETLMGDIVPHALIAQLAGWDGDEDSYEVPTEFTGVVVFEITGKRIDGSDFSFDKQQSFSLSLGGIDGVNGNIFNLYMTSSDQVFKYDAYDEPVGASEIVFNVVQQGSVQPIFWTPQVWNGSIWVNTAENIYFLGGTTTGLSVTLTEEKFQEILDVETPASEAVRILALFIVPGAEPEDDVFYIDTITIQKLRDGSTIPVGQLSNPTHITPAASDGSGFSLVGAGGTFRVWDGLDEVTGTGDGVNSFNGPIYDFHIENEFENLRIVIDPITGVYYLEEADAWNLSSTAVRFDLEALYKGILIVLPYSIIKGKAGAPGADGSNGTDAYAVKLVATKLVSTYASDGTTPNPATITATALDFSNTPALDPWYEFVVNDILIQASTSATYEYNLPANSSSLPTKIEVQYSDGSNGLILATDQITISALQLGSNAISVIASNESHTLPANASAVVTSYVGSGTTFQVYEGANPLTYVTSGPIAGQWTFTSIVETNIDDVTAPDITGTGTATAIIADHSGMSANAATIVYTINGRDTKNVVFSGITKTQSFAKSIQGTNGAVGSNGTNALTFIVTNESHTIPSEADGLSPVMTGSGTDIYVYEGTNELLFVNDTAVGSLAVSQWSITEANVVKVGITTVNDITLSGSHALVPQHTGFTTDVGSVTYPIHGKRADGTTFTANKVQSFAKSKKGSNGQNSKLVKATASAYTVKYNTAGTTPVPASITLSAASQGFADTYFKWTGGPEDTDGVGADDDAANYIDGDTATTESRVFTCPANIFNTPYNILCQAREGAGTTEEVRDSLTIAALRDGTDPILYYIKPINGTALFNGTGTLTLEAHKVTGGTDILLSTGNIKLYVDIGGVQTAVTSGNGFVAGSNGYTGIFNAANITNDVVVTMRDNGGVVVLDSITLVDVADGGDAVYGYIIPTAPISWTRASNQSTWTPGTDTVNLDCTFIKAGATVARRAVQVTRSAAGILTWASVAHSSGDLNPGNVTPVALGASTQSLTIRFDYVNGTDITSVSETVTTSMAGAAGSQGANARSVSLSAGTLTHTYGLATTPPNTTITATPFNTSGTVYYRFVKNGVTQMQHDTLTSVTYDPPDLFTNMPEKIEVELREGGTGTAILAKDTITMIGVQAGSDAITMVLSNEAHVFPASSTGAVSSYANSGTTIKVFEGANQLIYRTTTSANGEWQLTSSVGTGITRGALSGTGTNTLTAGGTGFTLHSDMSDGTTVASINYVIQGKRANGVAFSGIAKVQTFTKANAGAAGSTGATGATGSQGATAVVSALTNPAPVVTAASDGTGFVFTNTGGTHQVYSGITLVSSGMTHSIVGGTTIKDQSNLRLTVNASTGVYSFSNISTGWSSVSETFTLRVTYDGQIYDKVITITKALAGAQGAPGGGGGATAGQLTSTGIIAANGQNCSYQVHNDGTIDTRSNSGTLTNFETWMGSGQVNTSYECRLTMIPTSGPEIAPTGPGLGTWLPCSLTRLWSHTMGIAEIDQNSTIEIRRVTDNIVILSATVNWQGGG